MDALRPEVLIKLVENAVTEFIDLERMLKIKRQEQREIKKLEKFAKDL